LISWDISRVKLGCIFEGKRYPSLLPLNGTKVGDGYLLPGYNILLLVLLGTEIAYLMKFELFLNSGSDGSVPRVGIYLLCT
jgi:hypothetical protein